MFRGAVDARGVSSNARRVAGTCLPPVRNQSPIDLTVADDGTWQRAFNRSAQPDDQGASRNVLNLYFSNRFESLRDRLLENLAVAPPDPFTPEQIIVPGAAMKRRLEMDYAERFGICAQVEFGYLAQWVWQQVGLVIPVAQASPFDPERLTWQVFRLFGDADFVVAHARLAGYLNQADAVMRYELAKRVAQLIDQYITYRPDWIAAWSGARSTPDDPDHAVSQDESWQADLWRQLVAALGVSLQHPFSDFLATLQTAGEDAPVAQRLRPASLFGLPAIPPLYLDIVIQLAAYTDLDLYVLTPCREYWADLVDSKHLARLEACGQADYHEVGHPLLTAWGRQTQAFVALLHEKSQGLAPEHEDFVAPGRQTLLAAFQQGVLDLAPPGPFDLQAEDRSVEVHVCHSLTRELEVVHDRLLDLLSGREGITPGDVLVVLPGLEEAAPLIDAVFGTVPDDRRIPYVVTGLAPAIANPAASALLALFDLTASRFAASAVFDLLRRPLIQARFGLDAVGLESIHTWMRDAGICWGLDGAHRESLGLPGAEQHSLRDGLNRLFLGYAAPHRTESLGGRLPSGDAEGSEALALGAFDCFVGALDRVQRESSQPATGAVWRERLNRWLDDFLAVDSQSIHAISEVRDSINGLFDDLTATSVNEPLEFEVVRVALQNRLDEPARGALPSGAVTFAGMSPLRNLPYAVICMLGMNEDAYPTRVQPAEFDLIAQRPRVGDRQRRYDERNLFLDLVLATRKRLYLSYTGLSIRDNSVVNPSILLSELLDHLAAMVAGNAASPTARENARRRLLVRHPLQPFAAAYFDGTDPRLFSYASEYVPSNASGPLPPDAAVEETAERSDDDADNAPALGAPFSLHPLAWPSEQARSLTIDDLKRFLRSPCRYWLEQRLELSLLDAEEQLADDEPFLPDYHRRRALAERLLPFIRRGESRDALLQQAMSGTEYPTGVFGEVLLRQEISLLEAFGQQVEALTTEPLLEPVAGDLAFVIDGETWHLSGSLSDVRAYGLIRWRYDDTRATDYVAGWIDHLWLNALTPSGANPQTTWLSRDGSYRLKPCTGARDHLDRLIRSFRQGLAAPLHFFPSSAWAYARASAAGHAEPLTEARRAWEENTFTGFGESRKPAYRLALRGVPDPLDEGFEQSAADLFGPLLEHLEDARLP
jgi:exodeoxyribonuclease V gamma subunit